ncbi:MAG: acyltransferase family protein [Saccharofermentans sp.]|nr:acyltransferase family protein [Saccharofermentans sp.]
MDSNEKTHILWIDVAKGIGVYLVFLGHMWYACTPPVVNQVIYSFHVPLFFLLSGFVFDVGNKSQGFVGFVLLKAKRLLLPIVIYNVACALLFIPSSWNELGIVGFLNEIFCFQGNCYFNKPSWFFFTLFEIYILMYLVRLHRIGVRFKILLLMLLFIAGFFMNKYELVLFFGFDRVLITAGFFVLGSIAKDIYEKKRIPAWGHYVIIVGSIISLILFGVILNEKTSIYHRVLGCYPAFLLAGISGSICICYISQLISHLCKRLSNHFVSIGSDSVFIIGTHYLFTLVFCLIGTTSGMANTWYYTVIAILLSLISIETYHRICMVLDLRIPWLTGKRASNTSAEKR